MKTIILYLTTDGQTKKISEKLAEHLDNCTLVSLRDPNALQQVNLAEYEQIVIGAAIRYGYFDSLLYKFIKQHCDILNSKRSAFFGVNLTARKPNRNTPQTNTYTRKFLAKIDWKPTLTAVFAGALLYPRYGFFDRTMIRFIMKITGGETDTSREYELTDWEKVAEFGEKLAQQSI